MKRPSVVYTRHYRGKYRDRRTRRKGREVLARMRMCRWSRESVCSCARVGGAERETETQQFNVDEAITRPVV